MGGSEYIESLRSKVDHSLLLLPSVAAVILNEHNELLLHEKISGNWSLPAGMIEPGETPRSALVREVREETGLVVEPVKIIDVFGGRDYRYVYPNGDQVEYTVVLMRCKVLRNSHCISDPESRSTAYFKKSQLPELALPYPLSALFDEDICHALSR